MLINCPKLRKRWSEHDTDISRSHLRSHNWTEKYLLREILRRQIVKACGGPLPSPTKKRPAAETIGESGRGRGALRLKYTDRILHQLLNRAARIPRQKLVRVPFQYNKT